MYGKLRGAVVSSVVLLALSLAWSGLVAAQQQAGNSQAASPLVRLLQAKGILTSEEAAQINQASSASDADQRLAKLLLSKGVISQADYNQMMMGAPGIMNASGAELLAAAFMMPGTLIICL